MGKIVKYCAGCDESFAEKFAFCPNCGQTVSAFEMNPLAAAETKISDAPTFITGNNETVEPENNLTNPTFAPSAAETAPQVEIPMAAEAQDFSAVNQTPLSLDDAPDEKISAEDFTPVETKTFAAAAGANTVGNQFQTENIRQSNFSSDEKTPDDDYRITVIEEKNVGRRNGLLLGTMILMVMTVLSATVYSLFNRDLFVGAIDQDNPLYVSVIEDVPMEVEEQPKPKNDKDAGGGGGGGKEEPEPASKGRLVSQSENPITPPSVNIPQLKNPALPVIMETQGNIKRERTEERPGLPGSDNLNPSNGTGRGGGIGGGSGTGIGSGSGTGEGNGNGSGSGNGNGNGNGNGTGDGNEGRRTPPPPPPTAPVGVTQKYKIIAKPRADYTDLARQNQVTGTVTVKVTLLASGQVGNVSPVSGLPYGLTEKAIAAARAIKFEPTKKNGVPITTVATIQYSFTIY